MIFQQMFYFCIRIVALTDELHSSTSASTTAFQPFYPTTVCGREAVYDDISTHFYTTKTTFQHIYKLKITTFFRHHTLPMNRP
jgi:hypothetical protein